MKGASVALAIAFLAGLAPAVMAAEVIVNATSITRFRQREIGDPVGRLVFRGGIVMTSPADTFGGLSGVTLTGAGHQITFVSDRGNFVSGRLVYDEAARLFGFRNVSIEPIRNSRGDPLPRQYARDAEAIDTIYRNGVPVAVRVGFENLTRVADFALINGIPDGPAHEITIPPWLTDLRSNETLESVCIAPPASPIAGSTLLLTENAPNAEGNHRGYLLGLNDRGPVSYEKSPMVSPTECTFLPNGDLLVLERGVSMFSFIMNLRRVPAIKVRPGNLMRGELLLSASGSAIDNMEAMTIHTAPDGELRILIGSDNNFNGWQRNLLLEFALSE